MPFRVPTMPLTVNHWFAGTAITSPPDRTFMANLTPGKRAMHQQGWTGTGPLPTQEVAYLLMPARTDVRDRATLTQAPVVEVPAGTQRYYRVMHVDDVGRGFANEHRLAVLIKLTSLWPEPIP